MENPSLELPRRVGRRLTIPALHLRWIQRLHATAAVIVPLAGTVWAMVLVYQRGVTWWEIQLFLGMYVLTMIGVSIGFHRHFTHGAFRARNWVRAVLGVLGCMAFQGPLIYWVSNHRLHHKFGDQDGDLHSPHVQGTKALGGFRGFWHAHSGWTWGHDLTNVAMFAPDLLKDPLVIRLNRRYYAWVLLGLLLPAAIGAMVTMDWRGFLLGGLWGGLVRSFFTYHFTNSVNSVMHLFGSRSFDTPDHSTNNIWLALPTLGEAWHNNHHASPSTAFFGFKPWQIDPGGWIISALEHAGLIWDVKTAKPERVREKELFKD